MPPATSTPSATTASRARASRRTLDRRPRCRARQLEPAGHLARSRSTDELLADGVQDVRRAVRPSCWRAVERKRREAAAAGASSASRATLPAGARRPRSTAHARGRGTAGREGAPAVGARRHAVDRHATRRSWLGWLDVVDASSSPASADLQALADEVAARRLHARAAARHGRLEPVPRGAGADVRPQRRAARAARARLDRSRRRSRAVERSVDLARHARSSSPASRARTLEPNIFQQYFFERVAAARRRGRGRPALRRHHRSRLEAASSVGRGATASAASSPACRASAAATRRCRDFGMVPAAVMGLDVGALARRAPTRWSTRCRAGVPAADEPRRRRSALLLGACARRGRDKVTLVASPGIDDLGAWLEQLLAESTGKHGQGDHPGRSRAARRRRASTAHDRAVRLPAPGVGARRRRRTRPSTRSSAAGQPVVRIDVADRYDLGAGVLPLGDRDRGGRRRSSASTRSTSPTSRRARSRRSKLTDDLRDDRRAARRRRRSSTASGAAALRRRRERRGAARPPRRRRRSAALPARPPRRGSAPATTSRCSPTSR